MAGLDKPLGVTANHPIYSVDRRDFVRASELRLGETLRHLTGTTQITRIAPIPGEQPVHNLEVHGHHVYHVTNVGVLVHNSSLPDGVNPKRPDAAFGLSEHLDDFVDRLDRPTDRMPFPNLSDEADDLASGLRHAMERSERNQFNFEGFDVQEYDDWLRRGGPDSYPFEDVTNWELHELYNDHLLKTSFYGAPDSDFVPWPF